MVLAGLITFVLVAAVLRERAATVEVALTTSTVEAGTPVERVPVTVVALPASSPLAAVLSEPAELAPGSVVTRRLSAGEPLLRGDLARAGDGHGLRTVVVRVERLVIDGLALSEGDRVDIIGVDNDRTARYVVADVAVARVPSEAPLGLGRTADTATTWLTVSVTEIEALDLAASLGRGDIVVVRSTGAPVLAGSPVGQEAG
jgi:Flp pilus assembly protein CpaB